MHNLTPARQALAAAPPCLEAHSRQVAALALAAALLLRIPDPENIVAAAYLHDLGKTTWPPELFTKHPLEARDWAMVKAHPLVGENLAAWLFPDLPPPVRTLIRGHHERPGGKEYPDGLAEPGIEILLLATCGSYDAMVSDREYRPGGPVLPQATLLEVARFASARVVADLDGAVVREAG